MWVLSTAIYASETWKSAATIRQQLDVFHQRNLRKILGITWKDRMTNMEVLSRTGQRRLQDIVAERRLRMAGHIIRGAPDLDLAGYPVFFQDPVGSGSGRILKYGIRCTPTYYQDATWTTSQSRHIMDPSW